MGNRVMIFAQLENYKQYKQNTNHTLVQYGIIN